MDITIKAQVKVYMFTVAVSDLNENYNELIISAEVYSTKEEAMKALKVWETPGQTDGVAYERMGDTCCQYHNDYTNNKGENVWTIREVTHAAGEPYKWNYTEARVVEKVF